MREHDKRNAEVEKEAPQAQGEREQEAHTKFAARGSVPDVGGAFHDQAGTAQLAYAEEDEHERELKQKVGALVTARFGGDYKKAFEHYDTDGNGAVGKGELVAMLADAKVGNGITRGVWASKIIEKLDASHDTEIEWGEFESVFRGHA